MRLVLVHLLVTPLHLDLVPHVDDRGDDARLLTRVVALVREGHRYAAMASSFGGAAS